MQILFVENRYHTYNWNSIAQELINEGHNVGWIVQNKEFTPEIGKVYFINYPTKNDINFRDKEQFKNIIKSDRGDNYFSNKNHLYYRYYQNNINFILDDFYPDVVFGEATLFHELLTIELCKNLNIFYLVPWTTRYPNERFSFFKYDTLIPFGGSGESYSRNDAIEIIRKIKTRSLTPDYMKKKDTSIIKKIKSNVKYFKKIIKGYYFGEKFNTPAPTKKLKLTIKNFFVKHLWEKMSIKNIKKIKKNNFKILYPMHMQPESNIDVYGRNYRNQNKVIKNILANIPSDVLILIKPNPKAKYEMNYNLIKLIKSHERLIPLSLNSKMSNIFELSDLIITITGTIALEAIFSNKPIITMVNFINYKIDNYIYINEFSKLYKYIEMVKKDNYPKVNLDEKIDFLNYIISTSYYGVIQSKPYELESWEKKYLEIVKESFIDILKRV